MTEIKLQEKSSSMAWLWILLALLLLALLAWWLWPEADDTSLEPEVVAVEEAEPLREDIADEVMAEVPIPTILIDPVGWVDRTVSGTVEVVAVPTDRGFWIETGGERMLAILGDRPSEAMVDINPGMTLEIAAATVWDASEVEVMPGDPLEADTEALLADQDVFLYVDESALARYDG